MAELIRTEIRPSGLHVYVYKCDVCGGETERYHTRANQRKVCCDCQRRLDKENAKARQQKKEMQIRNKAFYDLITEFKKGIDNSLYNNDNHDNWHIAWILEETAEKLKAGNKDG